jgi:hypothetical protein
MMLRLWDEIDTSGLQQTTSLYEVGLPLNPHRPFGFKYRIFNFKKLLFLFLGAKFAVPRSPDNF